MSPFQPQPWRTRCYGRSFRDPVSIASDRRWKGAGSFLATVEVNCRAPSVECAVLIGRAKSLLATAYFFVFFETVTVSA